MKSTRLISSVGIAGHPRFFLGSDSAPHLVSAKATATPEQGCAAGVYTSPILLPLVAHLLDSFGALDKLQGFVSDHGRKFYKKDLASGVLSSQVVKLERKKSKVEHTVRLGDDEVAPFLGGKRLELPNNKIKLPLAAYLMLVPCTSCLCKTAQKGKKVQHRATDGT